MLVLLQAFGYLSGYIQVPTLGPDIYLAHTPLVSFVPSDGVDILEPGRNRAHFTHVGTKYLNDERLVHVYDFVGLE